MIPTHPTPRLRGLLDLPEQGDRSMQCKDVSAPQCAHDRHSSVPARRSASASLALAVVVALALQ